MGIGIEILEDLNKPAKEIASPEMDLDETLGLNMFPKMIRS